MTPDKTMNWEKLRHLFPFGSHLCREPMPEMSELKRDMENLKVHGFNLIKLQEHWMVNEPAEGQYNFSLLEELIDYAGKLDLAVYLGLTCQQAPFWLYQKHPDIRMVGKNGLPLSYLANSTLPSDGKPGPCPDHPAVKEAENRFIAKLVSTLGKYRNILVWNTWQEIGYWAEGITGQSVCYCQHTLNFFWQYLKEKYKDLDNLNRCWKTRYLDWPYISPSRAAGTYFEIQTLEWNYFIENVQIAACLKRRYQVIKENDPECRPVFAHKGTPSIGSAVDWTYARCQDFLGSSNYPAWTRSHPWDDGSPPAQEKPRKFYSLFSEMYDGCGLKFDYLRSCQVDGNPVWAAEFQGGPVVTGLHQGKIPSPQDIRRWVLSCLSTGVTGICFWVTRAEILPPEINGFGLLESLGETTERFEEASRIGRALSQFANLFSQPNYPQAAVGILIDELNYQGCRLLDRAENHLVYAIRTWHRLLWGNNILVDFISLSHDQQKLTQYKTLILPFPFFLSEENGEMLTNYVQQGGHLISGPCPGRINEYGFCPRGEISRQASKLFGVSHESLTMVAEPGRNNRWSFPERTWGEYLQAEWLTGIGPLV
ncbi:MAG: beta-galactosidase [Candidatus Omnitrophica bacterium]|nr:beta-galactosidase [Candidatus Omnitrophota bacterium]